MGEMKAASLTKFPEPSPSHSVTVPVPFSVRELLIMQLACDEVPRKEMAHRMGISRTRFNQISGVLCDKIGVHGILGVAVFALRNGLVK